MQLDPNFLDAYINLGNVLKEARIFDRLDATYPGQGIILIAYLMMLYCEYPTNACSTQSVQHQCVWMCKKEEECFSACQMKHHTTLST